MSRPIVLNNGINTAVSFDLKVINIRAAREGVLGRFRPICNWNPRVNQGKCANKPQRFHCQFVCNLGVLHADDDPVIRARGVSVIIGYAWSITNRTRTIECLEQVTNNP